MKRRDFLKYSLAAPLIAGAGMAYPAFAATGRWDRVLVLLELKGGNDGLNTVVPYSDPKYYDLRPGLAIARDKVLKTTEKLGFNPAFGPLRGLWDSGQMAVVLGVGYPKPNLSHFRGIDIWNSGSDADVFLSDGWISRLFRESRPGPDFAADGINLAGNPAGALEGGASRVVTLDNEPEQFLKQAGRIEAGNSPNGNAAMAHLLKQRRDLRSAAEKLAVGRIADVSLNDVFPDTELGGQFKTAARLLVAGVGAPVIKLTISKFDTHTAQTPLHDQLLGEIAVNIAAFAATMKKHGLWDKVAVMSYSEFGRRPSQNNSSGTDHGTASPQFLFGGRVRGGFYGQQPPLGDMENDNLRHRVHFREIYASLARQWWGLNAGFIREKPLMLFS